jgi:hypothetical protein
VDSDRFWSIVDSAKSRAGGDVDSRIETLKQQLEPLSASELQAFQVQYDARIRDSFRWDLWGAAYLMNGGCSDDGFRYFRDWLISEGRAVFEAALASPDSLAQLPRVELAELELFGYVALELYEQKGGGELARDFSSELTMPAGQEWTEEQLPNLFPALADKYCQ